MYSTPKETPYMRRRRSSIERKLDTGTRRELGELRMTLPRR